MLKGLVLRAGAFAARGPGADLARPVEPEVMEGCLEIAIQAPSGSDRQKWHFVIITDPALRQGLAELYRKSFSAYRASAPASGPGAPRQALRARGIGSAWTTLHLHYE